MSEKTLKTEASAETGGLRPIGLTFASVFFVVAGVYYLVFPFLAQDPTIVPLYVLGGLSLLGGFGVMRMTRWGLWLGLLLFPVQVIAPAFALQATLGLPGLAQDVELLAFVASLVILLFLGTLSFLLVLDKRKSFK